MRRRPSNPQWLTVSMPEVAQRHGQPGRHETPVISARCFAESGAIFPTNGGVAAVAPIADGQRRTATAGEQQSIPGAASRDGEIRTRGLCVPNAAL